MDLDQVDLALASLDEATTDVSTALLDAAADGTASSEPATSVDAPPVSAAVAAAAAGGSLAGTATVLAAATKLASATKLRRLRKEELKEGIDVAAASRSATDLQKDPSTVLAEYLNKRSESGLIQNWKKRWVMLVGPLLYYFEREDSTAPQGVILLGGATLQVAPQARFKGQECIVVRTKGARVFYLYGSAAQNNTWRAAIAAVHGVTLAGASVNMEVEPTATPAPATAPAPGVEAELTAEGAASPRTEAAIAAILAEDDRAPVRAPIALPTPPPSQTSPEAADLGVTDTISALMNDLPPSVQAVWLNVLATAVKAKALGSELEAAKTGVAAAEDSGSTAALAAQLEAAKEEAAALAIELQAATDAAARAEEARVAAEELAASAKADAAEELVRTMQLEKEAGKLRAASESPSVGASSAETELRRLLAEVASLQAFAAIAVKEKEQALALKDAESTRRGVLKEVLTDTQAEVEALKGELVKAQAAAGPGKDALAAAVKAAIIDAAKAAAADKEAAVKTAVADAAKAAAADKEAAVRAAHNEVASFAESTSSSSAALQQALQAAESARDSAIAELAVRDQAAAAALAAERIKAASLGAQLQAAQAAVAASEARLHALTQAQSTSEATSDSSPASEAALQEALAQAAVSAAAGEVAVKDANRLRTDLRVFANVVRENVGFGLELNEKGYINPFGVADGLRAAVEVKAAAAGEKVAAAAGFAKAALEKKLVALEASLAAAVEERKGLEQDMAEVERGEEQNKADAAAWMARATEAQDALRETKEEVLRLERRKQELEMALANAKAKLFNVEKPYDPAQGAVGLGGGTSPPTKASGGVSM